MRCAAHFLLVVERLANHISTEEHFQLRKSLATAALCAAGIVSLDLPALAQAGSPSKIDTGDTAFMLISAALVMLMTPALALFYGGMVRSKNVLGTMMQSFMAVGVVTVIWVLWGYSLAFGPDFHGFIGSLSWFGLLHVGVNPNPDYAPTIPQQTYMVYQMMFAIITPALISGAIAERIKFSSFLIFITLWVTMVYCPIAHWVWGHGGWLGHLHALDFAGGTVVHISSGISALVLALMIGKRHREQDETMRPHNLTMTLIGTALLWFGWFGFNGGSALASGALATSAFVATHIAAAAAALSWMFIEWKVYGKPTALGAASGAVAGLVAITPASGFVSPISALIIGAGVSFACFFAVSLKPRFGYDDTLEVFGVHCVGGTFGALATGLFASVAINAAGQNGLFFGNPAQLGIQAIGVVATLAYASIMTFILGKIIDRTIGLRVSLGEELEGLDESQHGETGYVLEV